MQANYRQFIKPIVVVIVAIGIILGGLQIYQSLQFHVVRTSPSINNFAAIAPYLKLYFNEPLTASGLSVTSDPGVFGEPNIQNKTLTLPINTTLHTNQTYTLTIHMIKSVSGKIITNKMYRFTPRDIPFQSLPKEMQQTLLTLQGNKPPTRNTYAYTGDDTLLNRGVPITVVSDLKQAVFNYIQSSKQKVNTIAFNNIVITPFDPNGSSPITTISFNLTFDNKNGYTAKLDYQYLTEAQLYLYDITSGTQIYNSGMIDVSQSAS